MFDSGVGGLSVLRQIAGAKSVGNSGTGNANQFVYLGDTARCPYGNRPQSEIAQFVDEIVSFLTNFQLDTLIMACNTSAAMAKDVAVEAVKRVPNVKLYDLIEPTSKYLTEKGTAKKLGVLATAGTVNSKAFSRTLKACGFAGDVLEVAAPLLVPIIESGRLQEDDEKRAELQSALKSYLSQMDQAGVDTMILGCTHFPFVAAFIRELAPHIELIDPAKIVAETVLGLDTTEPLNEPDYFSPAFTFYTTGSPEAFQKGAQSCLGVPVPLPLAVFPSDLKNELVTGVFSNLGYVSNVY